MRALGIALLLTLAACSSGRSDSNDPTPAELQQQVCTEVRKGINAFNRQDYAETVRHFVKAKKPAKINAKEDPEPEADALLDAVEYYANLEPAAYPEAARSSEHFARNKAITLGQCTDGSPIDEPDETLT
ncbi:hypothetical protein J2X11_001856 [Aeromicrobium panaciterrae]|uniref:Lipoprotein n=1 Tax=Aeromicrobium panaciterrae TaxID=363861 RepID=A0ABU1UPA3_9ACTN|nr:hypothetical protein [Aeromicrobium panaciterrae]MDR7087017.1 hypothetical protein [Aeromicrobium panaciterrae]